MIHQQHYAALSDIEQYSRQKFKNFVLSNQQNIHSHSYREGRAGGGDGGAEVFATETAAAFSVPPLPFPLSLAATACTTRRGFIHNLSALGLKIPSSALALHSSCRGSDCGGALVFNRPWYRLYSAAVAIALSGFGGCSTEANI